MTVKAQRRQKKIVELKYMYVCMYIYTHIKQFYSIIIL